VTYRVSGPIVSEVFKQAAEAEIFNRELRRERAKRVSVRVLNGSVACLL